MPKKEPSDLLLHEFVHVDMSEAQDGKLLDVKIRIHEKPSAERSVKGKSTEELRQLGVITTGAEFVSESQSDRASISQIRVETGDEVWRVLNSDASEAGWGPFLYDIVMELATIEEVGLCSHGSSVSPSALNVWANYFSNRNDVSKTKLPQELKPELRDECLQYMYHKSPPVTVEELNRLDKWIERHFVVD